MKKIGGKGEILIVLRIYNMLGGRGIEVSEYANHFSVPFLLDQTPGQPQFQIVNKKNLFWTKAGPPSQRVSYEVV